MSIQTYQPGELILAEGALGTQTFLIRSGEVEICKEIGENQRMTLATLGAGEMFGEMCLFAETGTRTASVVARTAVQVELIPRERIEAAMAETPEIIRTLLTSLSNRLAQTSQMNIELQTQQPEQ